MKPTQGALKIDTLPLAQTLPGGPIWQSIADAMASSDLNSQETKKSHHIVEAIVNEDVALLAAFVHILADEAHRDAQLDVAHLQCIGGASMERVRQSLFSTAQSCMQKTWVGYGVLRCPSIGAGGLQRTGQQG